MKRYQQYVRNSGLRPEDFEDDPFEGQGIFYWSIVTAAAWIGGIVLWVVL